MAEWFTALCCSTHGHGFNPTNACGYMICKYVDRKNSAAMLTSIQSHRTRKQASKRSTLTLKPRAENVHFYQKTSALMNWAISSLSIFLCCNGLYCLVMLMGWCLVVCRQVRSIHYWPNCRPVQAYECEPWETFLSFFVAMLYCLVMLMGWCLVVCRQVRSIHYWPNCRPVQAYECEPWETYIRTLVDARYFYSLFGTFEGPCMIRSRRNHQDRYHRMFRCPASSPCLRYQVPHSATVPRLVDHHEVDDQTVYYAYYCDPDALNQMRDMVVARAPSSGGSGDGAPTFCKSSDS